MKESFTYKRLKKNLDDKIFSRTGIISATKNPILKGPMLANIIHRRNGLDIDQTSKYSPDQLDSKLITKSSLNPKIEKEHYLFYKNNKNHKAISSKTNIKYNALRQIPQENSVNKLKLTSKEEFNRKKIANESMTFRSIPRLNEYQEKMIINKSPHCCLYRPQFFITKEKAPKYSIRYIKNNLRLQQHTSSPYTNNPYINIKLNATETLANKTKAKNMNFDFNLTLSRDYLEKQYSNKKDQFFETFQFSPTIPKISSKYKKIQSINFSKLLGRKELHDNSNSILQEYYPNYLKIFENQKGLIINYKNMIKRKPIFKDLSYEINYRNTDSSKQMSYISNFISSKGKRVSTPDLNIRNLTNQDSEKLPSHMCKVNSRLSITKVNEKMFKYNDYLNKDIFRCLNSESLQDKKSKIIKNHTSIYKKSVERNSEINLLLNIIKKKITKVNPKFLKNLVK